MKFLKWESEDVAFGNSSKDSTFFIMPPKAVTVTAVFLDTTDNSAGSTEYFSVNIVDGYGSGESYEEGDTVNISAGTKSGYRFKNWTVTDNKVKLFDTTENNAKFVMPAEPVTVTANFIATFRLTLVPEPDNGGNIAAVGTDIANLIDSGTVITINATERDGYTFDSLLIRYNSGNAISVTNTSTTVTMTSNVTVTAYFSQNVGGGGTIDIDTGFVNGQDGTRYKWVKIGGKKWMAENLNEWSYGYSGGVKCYNGSTDSCGKYGALYTWAAAQTVCPRGWELPSRDDWGALVKAVGGAGAYGEEGEAGLYLKSTGGWSGNGNGQNTYKFEALPGGYMFSNGTYDYAGSKGVWWTATPATNNGYYLRGMSHEHNRVSETTMESNYGLSVRCVSSDN